MRFSSVLVGRGALLVACAEVWSKRGHSVVAIASDCVQATAWARANGVACVAQAAALPTVLQGKRPDFLFSIVCHEVLPPVVLALADRAAVNYHDSLLPAYGGFHATTWALLDGRVEHGITWHRMTDTADAGPVLLQRRFPIGDGDTAFTLSARAAQMAVSSFGDLVAGLDGGLPDASPAAAPQDFHFKSERPAGIVVDGTQTVQQVQRWARAFDFGSEDNWLTRLKLRTPAGDLLCVDTALSVPINAALLASEPGTVLAMSATGIELQLSDGVVRLRGLVSLDGAAIDMAACGLAVGARVVAADAASRDASAALDRDITRVERQWVARLAEAAPPTALGLKPEAASGSIGRVSVALPTGSGDEGSARLAAALAVYATRVAGETSHVTLGQVVAGLPVALHAEYAPVVPLSMRVGADWAASLAHARNEIAFAQRARTHARDVRTRYAVLRAVPAERRLLAVALGTAGHAMAEGVLLQIAADADVLELQHDTGAIDARNATRLGERLAQLIAAGQAAPATPVSALPLTTSDERNRLLSEFQPVPRSDVDLRCIHELFEAQAARTPDRTAIAFRDASLTYAELDARANALAHRLRDAGVGPGELVALSVERSLEMVVGLLAILKAGGAYVPLDPAYPAARIAMMLEDSRARWLVTQEHLFARHAGRSCQVLLVDAALPGRADPPLTGVTPADLAYVIFTSGSTGRPKGVMIEHRNVANFFAGMDAVVGTEPGVWLAVTSISFDISVLELFWTLARGFEVVLQEESDRTSQNKLPRAAGPVRPMGFGLFYFAADSAEAATHDRRQHNAYRLLLEGARFADAHGFAAVWTPERHFHAFGGMYPNPAVTSAALATITSRVQLRAGSVVLPLHDPLRVAEEWAVVDNLSQGRVGLSFASGWHANDFVLQPDQFERRHAAMREGIASVLHLWAGGTVKRRNGQGEEIDVGVLPRPVNERPPMWIASAGNVETFRSAGHDGHHVLTNMLGQTLDDLRGKLAAYREARRAAGHAGEGIVSVMLHTFVNDDDDAARRIARGPFGRYLRSSYDLVKVAPWMFPAFQRPGRSDTAAFDAAQFDDDDMQALLDHAFERYVDSAGLFGTPERALALVEQLRAIGVDEVACLVDFGIDADVVLANLPHLDRLRQLANPAPAAAGAVPVSVREQFERRRITHFQCTPSMARLFAADGTLAAMGSMKHWLIGGEALPPELRDTIVAALPGSRLVNMYGPTETTVWSTTAEVALPGAPITIGRPIANTQVRILDAAGGLLPAGVAGELCIGGAGVVRGYLDRPELTAERFIADPFQPGNRLYRTGDLASWREDGSLAYLGRIDQQVKLNGYRIELGEIEALLARHPAVRQAVVAVKDGAAGPQLVAYVTTRAADETQAVEGWRQRWDEAYTCQVGAGSKAPRFNTSGWLSSYDGEPIASAPMREWLDTTVERLQALRPRRVLEIGCGTGMLLYACLPGVEHYTALDVSAAALEAVRAELTPQERDKVTLMQRAAHELDTLPSHAFDLVVINSVAQYFPDADYLLRVFQAAARLLEDGGALFLGDVRSLEQARAFHARAELESAAPEQAASVLAGRVAEREAHESELLLGQGFFALAARDVPRLRLASVQMRQGRLASEMRDFRQDIVWRAGAQPAPLSLGDVPVVDATALPAALAKSAPLLLVKGLENARLRPLVRVLNLLDAGQGTAETLLRSLDEPADGTDPDALGALHPDYVVEARFGDTCGRFDALFRHRATAPAGAWMPAASGAASNLPARRSHGDGETLARQWRAHLKARLPEFMLPQAFVVLASFPLTPNGKVDRNALPRPDAAVRSAPVDAVPANQLEAQIAAIWCELLAVAAVGRNENLFDLGASSLLAVEANNRLQLALARKIPLVAMFRYPTIEALAAHLAPVAPAAAVADTGRQDRLASAVELRRQARSRLGSS